MAGFLSVSDMEALRLKSSVIWTERYRDRVQSLLSGSPERADFKKNGPVRGLLLQNIFGGREGLMCLMGRDPNSIGFMVNIVGINQFPTTSNQFKLRLSGGKIQDDGSVIWTQIGDKSSFINCVSTASEFQTALLTINTRLLTPENVSVGLGNPYFNPDLVLYTDPVDPVVKAPVLDDDIPASYLGCWYIQFDTALDYDDLKLEIVDQTITSLSNVIVSRIFDLIDTETTIVTDVAYRTPAYPWQVGTIATCVDYADCGYGIIFSTARTLDIQ